MQMITRTSILAGWGGKWLFGKSLVICGALLVLSIYVEGYSKGSTFVRKAFRLGATNLHK